MGNECASTTAFPLSRRGCTGTRRELPHCRKGPTCAFTIDSLRIRDSFNCPTTSKCSKLDPKSNKLKDSISLQSLDTVASGKTTPNLAKAKSALATTCFAAIGRKTYEFECGDKKTRDVWL